MFLQFQEKKQQQKYKEMLKCVGALSNLSSESSSPYIGYRTAENVFCESFGAENLSRSDCSADASKGTTGVGLKTFLNGNGKTLQKVAEFNKDSFLYSGKTPKEIVYKIAELRNERIQATKRIHGLTSLIYHCVVRDLGKIIVFECNMDEINMNSIKSVLPSKNTIAFEDGLNEYSFNMSKSTLYKRFYTKDILMEFDVKIIENPYEMLVSWFNVQSDKLAFTSIKTEQQHIFLPLFSDRGGRNVPEKSGLNQWNAGGRARHYNEIYIPIPAWIHKKFPDFFPKRDTAFNLKLPDANVLVAKICQDGGKALMSNPNADLGNWLLRKVMNLEEGELLTYQHLENLGLDSVVIYKEEKTGEYTIDFTEIGSYDDFVEDHK